ncbi:MAG: 50S ribosomal protein L23 [Candidatus Micrarchaeia archaeon]
MAIIKAVNTEKASRLLDKYNKLELVVDTNTTKESLTKELKAVYGLKVKKVNMLCMFKGNKKAIVTLDKSHTVDEIATKFGLIV